MSVQHFLLTRFNIASYGREAKIRSRPGWLERRLTLFENYCLPSIAGQDAKDFCWLIYFDEATAPHYRRRIENLRSKFPFLPQYVANFRPEMAAIDIAKRLHNSTQRVVSTRLDNDDALARGYLSTVREAASSLGDDTVIEFRSGLELRSQLLYETVERHGPFVSMVEGRDNIQTVWSHQHQQLNRHYKIELIDVTPAWLRVIHDDNVSNRVKGRLLPNAYGMSQFAIHWQPPIRSPNPLALALDRTILFPMRRVRELGIELAKVAYRLFLRR